MWRLVLVSRIQSNTLRRLALVVTLPLMFAYWVALLALATLGFAATAALHVALALVYPLWHLFASFPVELFRSFALRWKVPLEPQA